MCPSFPFKRVLKIPSPFFLFIYFYSRRPVSVSSHPSNTTAACQEVLFDPVRGGAGSAVAAAANGSEYANAPDQDDDRVLPIKVWGVWLNKDEMPALPRNNYATAVGGGIAAVASAESAADEIDTNEKDHDGVGPGVRRNGGLFVHESVDQVAAAPEDAGDAARSADEAIADASGGGAARNAEPLQSEGKAASYNVGDVPEVRDETARLVMTARIVLYLFKNASGSLGFPHLAEAFRIYVFHSKKDVCTV